MQVKIDPAVVLGNELRYARMARHKRQREVATEISASQSMVSRMELGHGSTMSLGTWAAAAEAVDRRLVVDLVGAAPSHATDAIDSIQRQCHRTVTTTARDGGWTSVTEIQMGRRRERVETTMIREDLQRVVVHAWVLVSDVDAAIEDLQRSIRRERQRVDEGWRIGGLVVVPSGRGNRRRMTEARSRLSAECPTLAAHWYRALVRADRPMPDQPGVLWATRDGERLLPAPLVPGWMWISPDRGSRALRRRVG